MQHRGIHDSMDPTNYFQSQSPAQQKEKEGITSSSQSSNNSLISYLHFNALCVYSSNKRYRRYFLTEQFWPQFTIIHRQRSVRLVRSISLLMHSSVVMFIYLIIRRWLFLIILLRFYFYEQSPTFHIMKIIGYFTVIEKYIANASSYNMKIHKIL